MTEKMAIVGDKIKFQRMGFEIFGEVCDVKETSVVVRISDDDAGRMQLETPLTVVSHKNYKVIV